MLAVMPTSFYGDTIVGDNEMLSKNNLHTIDDHLCKKNKIPPTLGGSTFLRRGREEVACTPSERRRSRTAVSTLLIHHELVVSHEYAMARTTAEVTDALYRSVVLALTLNFGRSLALHTNYS